MFIFSSNLHFDKSDQNIKLGANGRNKLKLKGRIFIHIGKNINSFGILEKQFERIFYLGVGTYQLMIQFSSS
jgi:hypothetical protein